MFESQLTLLICTCNNDSSLERTLEAIARQRVDDRVGWDVLVVDNNCTDDTVSLVRRFQADCRMPSVHLETEKRQGVGYARKTGLARARGRWVGFVDDDCVLDDDWVAAALKFAGEHPEAAVVGSRVELLWECPPPPYGEEVAASLAQQDFGESPLRLPRIGRQIPCGAGLLLRRDAVLDSGYLSFGILPGRGPVRLDAGEDAEVGFFVRNAGNEVWFNPAMRVEHHIPPWRTELPYLRRLHRGFGRAESHLHLLSLGRPPTLINRLREVGNAVRELSAVVKRYRAAFRKYPRSRPSLSFGLRHALGYLEGALLRLLIGHRR